MHSHSGSGSAGPLRIASRGSELALWQAHFIRDELHRAHPGLEVEIVIIHTTGDRITDVPLAQIGDRGLFTKEIDSALLEGRADLAVHSLKDVPTRIPDGLSLAAISERADPRDVVIAAAPVAGLDELPAGARVGTSSLRRRSQLRAARPDLEVIDLRGNLNTRLAKLDRGEYDAIILAAAGVSRLGWEDRISLRLEPDDWLPAVGQGALAIVARDDDARALGLLRTLHHPVTAAAVRAERALLAELEGGCQIPIGALGTVSGDTVHLEGLVADLEGQRVLRRSATGSTADPEALGRQVAGTLVDAGAREILDEIRDRASAPPPPAP